jgi:hypothetical protein
MCMYVCMTKTENLTNVTEAREGTLGSGGNLSVASSRSLLRPCRGLPLSGSVCRSTLSKYVAHMFTPSHHMSPEAHKLMVATIVAIRPEACRGPTLPPGGACAYPRIFKFSHMKPATPGDFRAGEPLRTRVRLNWGRWVYDRACVCGVVRLSPQACPIRRVALRTGVWGGPPSDTSRLGAWEGERCLLVGALRGGSLAVVSERAFAARAPSP